MKAVSSGCGLMLLGSFLFPTPAESQQIVWAEPIEVATGEAYQGPWRQNRSEFFFVDDPTVGVNEEGAIGVVWTDQKQQELFFQRYAVNGEKQLERPVRVSRSPDVFSWLPRIVMGPPPSHVYVLWQEIVFSGGSHGGDILFARSVNRGASFEIPINLSNSLGGDGKGRLTERYWHNGSLDLTTTQDGVIYATWTEYGGALWLSHSTDAGVTFSQPYRIAANSPDRPARGPSIAVHEGVVYVAWTIGEDEAADIRLSRSLDGGKHFDPPQVVAHTPGHSDTPKIVADAIGVLHLVFAESPGGPFERYHIRYLRSSDSGQTFDSLRLIPNPSPERYPSGNFPSLAILPDGTLYVLWELFTDARRRPTGLGFALSSDAGETFSSPEIIPGSIDPRGGHNGSRQGLLMRKLAVGPNAQPAIVNSTFREGQSSHIWLWLGRVMSD